MDRAKWLRMQNRLPNQRDNSWYRITNSADGGVDVYIYDEIGYWGVTAKDFVAELANAGDGPLTVHINTPGGDVFDGLAIYNAIAARDNTTTVVDGIAASAGSFIMQAGKKRRMTRNGQVMIHNASGLVIGEAKDMREMADLLDKTTANIADIYAQRSGTDLDTWLEAMDAETWYSGQEAVDAGLADEVVGAENSKDSKSTESVDDEMDMDRLVALLKEAWQ